MPDLNINSVSAPLGVTHGTPFNITVSTTSTAQDFEDGVSYRLFVFVTGLQGLVGAPTVITGSLDEATGWNAQNFTFPTVTMNAGASFPDLYTVTAALIEGRSGLGELPASFASSGPILVI